MIPMSIVHIQRKCYALFKGKTFPMGTRMDKLCDIVGNFSLHLDMKTTPQR